MGQGLCDRLGEDADGLQFIWDEKVAMCMSKQ